MIYIDGSFGGGGGQMLRTAIGLSACTGKPLRIKNIRVGRKVPGLKEQHLQAVRAVSVLCGGSLEGDGVGSSEVTFIPGTRFREHIRVSVRTAGSVGLIIQALSIAAWGKELSVEIEGGATFGLWAPPVYYLSHVLAPLLRKMNYELSVVVKREGFYPAGGSLVSVKISSSESKALNLTEAGEIESIGGISAASVSLGKREVAERQARAAQERLSKRFESVEIQERYSEAACPGSGILLWAKTRHSILGGSSVGELRKRSESVGSDAARDLMSNLKEGAVDRYAADQLLPFLALAGGTITTGEITEHARTNAHVIEKMLPVRISIEGKRISVLKEIRAE